MNDADQTEALRTASSGRELFSTRGEQVLHRRSVQDAKMIADLQSRVRRLERRRWWHFGRRA